MSASLFSEDPLHERAMHQLLVFQVAQKVLGYISRAETLVSGGGVKTHLKVLSVLGNFRHPPARAHPPGPHRGSL
jgi:hypothetical protein